MMVTFRWLRHDMVIDDHRPMGSDVMRVVLLEWRPSSMESVLPGLKSVVDGIGLLEVLRL